MNRLESSPFLNPAVGIAEAAAEHAVEITFVSKHHVTDTKDK
jgi:hypothetical protein